MTSGKCNCQALGGLVGFLRYCVEVGLGIDKI